MKKIWLYALLLIWTGSACTSDQSKDAGTDVSGSQQATVKSADPAFPEKDTESETDLAPAGPDQTIVPGKSVGIIKLNEQSEVVMKLLGKPAKKDAAMGKLLATWSMPPPATSPDTSSYKTSIFFVRDMGSANPDSQAKQIRVTSPEYRLENKLGVGSDLQTVQAYFPEIKKTITYAKPGTKEEIIIYHDVNSGIAFEINSKGKVIGVGIQKPGEKNYEVYTAVASELYKHSKIKHSGS